VSAGEGSFDEWCREAADRFLQSALVIDDKATLEADAQVAKLKTPSPESDSQQEEDTNDPTEPPEMPLDAKALIDEFAVHGLVCGVMRPGPDEPSAGMVVPTAARADIVLLDWRLRDKGERALEILKALATKEGLRLIAIYTSAGGLDEIAATVCQQLEDSSPDGAAYAHEEGSFRVTGDGLTIEIYAKEGSPGTPEEEARQIPPQDLPGRLIEDFARMTHGLVPSAAIATVGALRTATPRVLGLLGRNLDPGYLGHRILLPDPDESGDHLIELIGSELRTVIEDNDLVRKAVGREVIERFVDDVDPGDLTTDVLKEALRIGVTAREAKAKLNERPGVSEANPKLVAGSPKSQTHRFTDGDKTAAKEADRRFAIKLSLQTPSGVKPRLGLGTIVKGTDDAFLICLQPECDSVRLDEARGFPFLPLTPAEEFDGQDLLVDADGPVGLQIACNPYKLLMLDFDPDPARRAVIAQSRSGSFVFESTDSRRWAFAAQLRKGHSRHLAHRLASDIGRVGIDESEVQRLWQKKKN
jgi:hypothetical protein